MGEPILYILMRNDLASMNPGKAMAQSSHAASQFAHFESKDEFAQTWIKQTTGGFGTVLVLSVSQKQLHNTMQQAEEEGFMHGLVSDPTYPYQVSPEIAALIPEKTDTDERIEGKKKVTLFRKEFTCGYVFGAKEDLAPIVGKFPLYK